MRILMLSTPFPTHFTPMISLAWALRGAGHDLLVVGQPDTADVARSAGLSTKTLGGAVYITLTMTALLSPGMRLIQMNGRPAPEKFVSERRIWSEYAKVVLPRYLEFAQAWRPDLIISDTMEFTGVIIGALLGVPVVRHRWGIDAGGSSAAESVREELRETCTELGLAGLPDPDLILDPCPRSLQVPGVPPALPIRSVPFNGAGSVPDWAARRPGARLVCVSLGTQTLVMNGVPLVKGIISAMGELSEVDAVVTADTEFHQALGSAPENVMIVAPTPLDLFLHECDAIVHHSGASTIMTACRAGLPQLGLPQHSDQFAAADQLTASGAAICFDEAQDQDDQTAVREAVWDLLHTPSYREAATELQCEMLAMPTPADVVGELDDLAAGGRSVASNLMEKSQ